MRSFAPSGFDELHGKMPGRGVPPSGVPPGVPIRGQTARRGSGGPGDFPPRGGHLAGEVGMQDPFEQPMIDSSAGWEPLRSHPPGVPRGGAKFESPGTTAPGAPHPGALHDKPWNGTTGPQRTASGRGAGIGTTPPSVLPMGGKMAWDSPALRQAIPLPKPSSVSDHSS